MAIPVGTLVAIAGTTLLLVATAVGTGIIVNVVNKGEQHKENMLKSPPPPPPTSRQLFEEPSESAQYHDER